MANHGALILAVPHIPSDERLGVLRAGLLEHAGLDMEDFYPGGPLVVITEDADLPFDVPAPLPLIDVHLVRKYFGPTSTLGHPLAFIACAGYAEANLGPVRVFYGERGDGPAVEFTEAMRERLMVRYAQLQGGPGTGSHDEGGPAR